MKRIAPILVGFFLVAVALAPHVWATCTGGPSGTAPELCADTGQLMCGEVPATMIAFPNATQTLNACLTTTVPATAICTVTPTPGACALARPDGTFDPGWVANTSTVTGTNTGTNNYIPKWVTNTATQTATTTGTATATVTVTVTSLGNSPAYANGSNVCVGNTNCTTPLGVTGQGSMSSLQMPGSSSGAVTIQPAAAAGTWSMTLPNSAGSNGQVMETNGSGVMSWASPMAGNGVTCSGTNTFNATNGQVTSCSSTAYDPYGQATTVVNAAINGTSGNLCEFTGTHSVGNSSYVKGTVIAVSGDTPDVLYNRLVVAGPGLSETIIGSAPNRQVQISNPNSGLVSALSGDTPDVLYNRLVVGSGLYETIVGSSPTRQVQITNSAVVTGSILASDVTSSNGAVVSLVPTIYVSLIQHADVTLTVSGSATANTQCRISIVVDGSAQTHGRAMTNAVANAFWGLSVTLPLSVSTGSHSYAAVLDQTGTPGDTCSVLASSHPEWYHANLSVTGI